MPTLRARPPPPPPAPSSSRPPPPPPVLFDPVPPPTEPVLALRREWKFAAVCQFVFTFEEALQLGGEFETEEFEDDLTLGSHKIVNKLVSKMLVILTYDRRITEDDWERSLRHQYERRAPEVLLLGTEEEPVTWAQLKPLQRVEAIHTVSEWLLVNPNNLRRKMKDEESAFLWRIEPIGYDAKKNAYWLFDDNRLWVQHAPPKPKVSHKKKERPPPAQPPQKKQKLSASQGKGKAQTPAKFATPAPKPKQEEEVKSNGRYPRRAAASKPPPPSPTKTPPKPRVMGIRQSSRLRGKEEEQEGWQEIPEEWLAEGGSKQEGGDGDQRMEDEDEGKGKGKGLNGNGTGRKRALEEEGESDLTDLSDDDGPEEAGEKPEKPKEAKVEKAEPLLADVEMKDATEEDQKQPVKLEDGADATAPSSSLSSPPATPPPPPRTINGVPVPDDFVEWETIAVTLYQWEHIAERFEKSTNRDERALWGLLVEDVVPRVLRELREIEKLRKKEELMATRKRSSRLQMKELELEQKRLEEEKRVEVEVANARNRRAEEREKRQEMEREERERKAKEREERALRREAWVPGAGSATPGAGSGGEGETGDSSTAVEEAGSQKGRKKQKKAADGDEEGEEEDERLRGPGEEKWELDCEICGKKGWNVDDGKKMACCEQCNKWQHTACHDAADLKAGRQKRRWAQVTFKCKECRNKHRRELYAKRQEATRLKQEEERAKMIAAGLPVDGLPGAVPGMQPQANGDLKIHLTLPKIPSAVPNPPVVNGTAQPQAGGTPGGSRPSAHPQAQGSVPRVRTSPKVPLANGHAAPFYHSSSPAHPNAPVPARPNPPVPMLDRRTPGSHSPTIPLPPYTGYTPLTAPTHPHPQHRSYQTQFPAYPPSMGYPPSNTGASSPHTPQTQPHPPHPHGTSHPATAPPSSSSSPHQPRSPQAPAQHSQNPQQPGQSGYQYGYPAAYGTPGYAYGFSHGRPSPQQQQQQQQQYYQYYQTYGAAAAGDPRYAAHGAAYPHPPGKQPQPVPTGAAAGAPPTNGTSSMSLPVHRSPETNGHVPIPPPLAAREKSAAAKLPEMPPPPVSSSPVAPVHTPQPPLHAQPPPTQAEPTQ